MRRCGGRLVRLAACVLLASLAAPIAAAQAPKPKATPPTEAPARTATPVPGAPLPYAPAPAAPTPQTIQRVAPGVTPPAAAQRVVPGGRPSLYLIARLTADGAPVRSGLVWRVFRDTNGQEDRLKLVATASGGDAEFRLEPGTYVIHAGYGRAAATTKVVIDQGARTETLVLNAGGLKLAAAIGPDQPAPSDSVTFDVYAGTPDANGERQLIVLGAKPDRVIRLKADRYHVVSHYGSQNAVMRADLEVQPGKLTEATLFHKAATLTLKLVPEPGGEALANVEWTVATPDGKPITKEALLGAFPKVTLAEGEYTVLARHQGQVFMRTFSVDPGQDQELEVVADKPRP